MLPPQCSMYIVPKMGFLAMARDMVKTSVGEFLEETAVPPARNCQSSELPHSPNEQDIDAMVASLKLFEQ